MYDQIIRSGTKNLTLTGYVDIKHYQKIYSDFGRAWLRYRGLKSVKS